MRIYIPASSLTLERFVLDGALEVSHAFAVTPALREWYSGDDEELEYLAATAAARHSLELLGPGTLARRVVIAADVEYLEHAEPGSGPGHRAMVQVAAVLPADAIAAALVDGPEAEADVRAAVAMLPRAASDDDARFAIDQAQSHELLWFAAQELPFIF